MSVIELRHEALRPAELGFRVFPVHEPDADGRCGCGDPSCTNAGKHPATRRGLHEGTRSSLAIENWWRTRSWNIGVCTGDKAIVLDEDLRHGGGGTIATLEKQHGPLVTWISHTGGGGRHFFFATPPGRVVQNSAGRVGEGCDVRGVGGFVVGPSSRHASGRTYQWDEDCRPGKVALAEMPPWLVDLCAAPVVPMASMPGARFDATGFVGAGIVEGGRSAKLTSLTGHLLRRYVDPRLVLELVAAFNDARCQPPLAQAEVLKIVESIAGRELRRRRVA